MSIEGLIMDWKDEAARLSGGDLQDRYAANILTECAKKLEAELEELKLILNRIESTASSLDGKVK